MIQHLVLFKLKPGVDAEKIDWMLREIRIQLLKISVVRGLRCGYRINSETEWPLFLLVELDSAEKIPAYMNDPAHLRLVSEVIKPNIIERLALDFQTDPGIDPLLT
mgnify:CR=1 FL=1